MNATAWSYLVVSSDQQAETLDAQQTWAEETAASHGWQIERVYRGVSSGKLGVRKLLSDLIEELRSLPARSRPKRILLTRIDRLGRGDSLETMGALAELKRLGPVLHTREDGDVKLEKATDSILPAIKSIVAAVENEVRADRVRAGHARRRAAGKHLGMVPYGVVLVDGKPVTFEPEAAIVREIFDLLGERWGLTRIANRMRATAPPKRLSDGSERPLKWGASTIRSLYTSEVLRRVVVSPEAIARAEAARADNYRYAPTGEWEWPLRGAVWCTCGHRLIGHATGVPGYRVRYYRCRHHPQKKGAIMYERPGHRADDLEAAFLNYLEKIAVDPSLFAHEPPRRDREALVDRVAELERRLAKIEARRRRACEFAEDGVYSAADLRERLVKIDAERIGVSENLARARGELAAAEGYTQERERIAAVLERLPRLWKVRPVAERQRLARTIGALVGGLWADPRRRGELLLGYDATLRRVKDNSTTATYEHMFSCGKVLAEFNR